MKPDRTAQNGKLRILYVSYPLLPVSENSAGGAEQVLWTLEREIHTRGHSTFVGACSGSQVAGELVATGEPAELPDQFEARSREQTDFLLSWLRSNHVDLIHDMSGDFWKHARGLNLPVLATLHLPAALARPERFPAVPDCVSFNCVSQAQLAEFNHLPRMIGFAQNGIALDRFPNERVPREKREYLLWIGRICEEKGTHTALDVAHAAGEKVIIAGSVYPFLYHQKYFAREVIPRLKRAGSRAKYVERPGFVEKVDLIRNARALLITSEINETSSLVAMEAAVCGTPVIALRRGALPEVISEGVTGTLADNAEEMAAKLTQARELNPEECRQYADEHYSAQKMADRYQALYPQTLLTVYTNRRIDVL